MAGSPGKKSPIHSPLNLQAILDLYYLDARSKLLDIAAFLDRIERIDPASASANEPDFRMEAFKKALNLVAADGADKTRAVQMALSDPTLEPLESAAGMKGALGAYRAREKGRA